MRSRKSCSNTWAFKSLGKGENAKLKRLLAEAHLDIHALNTAFGVKR